jgi:5-formyltetrahydrofolate cyclo-ligase
MKQEFRNFCLKQKKINRYYYSKIIGKELYKMAKNYKRILFFIPLKDEVDIYWVLKKLRKERKEIFVPFMEDLSFKMVKYQLPLQKKRFSILEPINKQKTLSKVDLAIVPIVGMDKDFRRIGFGKGMYDRFFDNLSYKPMIVFVQLKPCISLQKLSTFYDIKANEYISFKVRRKNDNMGYSRYFFITSRGVFYSKKI